MPTLGHYIRNSPAKHPSARVVGPKAALPLQQSRVDWRHQPVLIVLTAANLAGWTSFALLTVYLKSRCYPLLCETCLKSSVKMVSINQFSLHKSGGASAQERTDW